MPNKLWHVISPIASRTVGIFFALIFEHLVVRSHDLRPSYGALLMWRWQQMLSHLRSCRVLLRGLALASTHLFDRPTLAISAHGSVTFSKQPDWIPLHLRLIDQTTRLCEWEWHSSVAATPAVRRRYLRRFHTDHGEPLQYIDQHRVLESQVAPTLGEQ